MYTLIHRTTGEYYTRTGQTLGQHLTSPVCCLVYFDKALAESIALSMPDFDLIHIDVIKQKL